MFKLFVKIVSPTICWVIFTYVILQIPYPETLIQANTTQILAFFIPLFLALSQTLNIFLKNILISISVSLSLITLLILKSLDALNLVTVILIVITLGLLISYFRKTNIRNLTNHSKILKLTQLRK